MQSTTFIYLALVSKNHDHNILHVCILNYYVHIGNYVYVRNLYNNLCTYNHYYYRLYSQCSGLGLLRLLFLSDSLIWPANCCVA